MSLRSTTIELTSAVAAAGILAFASPAAADDMTVTSTADAGTGSLRELLILANADLDHDRIILPAEGQISLLSPLPQITEPLTVDGPGARKLTVKRAPAAPSMRVFDVDDGVSAEIEGVTVANGYTNYGANISNSGDLTLDGVAVVDGFADSLAGSESYGGGIYNRGDGRMVIRNSTIAGNRARNPEYVRGAGIANAAELLIVNSTITGNTSTSINNAAPGIEAGGLMVVDGRTTLRGVTIAGNESRRLTLPGNAANVSVTDGAELVVTSSIIADPVLAENCNVTDLATVGSGGFNLSDSDGCGLTAGTDRIGDPGLGDLADNGGGTDTMLPAAAGPAVDAGLSGGDAADQRGLPRAVDQGQIADASGGDGTDIGAVELPDTTAPETVIATAPKGKVKLPRRGKRAKVHFGFASDDPSARFECDLDGAGFEPCGATLRAKLRRGRHTLEVRAVDAAGLSDATPAKARTKVKRKRRG